MSPTHKFIPCLAAAIGLLTLGGIAQALDKPENIVCRNNENLGVSEVKITWRETSDDETSYRVERKQDGGAFAEMASIAADSKEYLDTGLAVGNEFRYRVRAHRSSDDTFGPYSDVCRRMRVFDTPDFRLYYRPYPVADCPMVNGQQVCVPAANNAGGQNEMAARIAGILDDSRDSLMDLGFNDVAFYDGAKRLPIDLIWCDGGGCAGTRNFGNGRKGGIGLAPVFMGAFDTATGTGDPSSVLVTLHELFHQQQYTYGGIQTDPAGNWIWEGQARSIQDKICIGSNRATCISLDSVPNGLANYLGEVNRFLSNTNRSVPNLSYGSALFWTYATEKYGTLNQEPELGMDLMLRFWEKGAEDINDDGIGTLNRALAAMGHTERFRDIFKDFGVANYAKDLTGPSVPSKYKYADETQPPGSYNPVALRINRALGIGDQVGPTTDDVVEWGTRYYQVRPAADLPILSVEFRQDTSNDVYYTLLAIKGDDIALEINETGRDFVRTFANDGYDRVVVVVSALDNYSNFRYSFNATQPILNIVDPLQVRRASAGDPAAPEKILVKVEVLSPVGAGAPVAGIDASDFTITVGTQTVSASQRISDAYIQGQYWMLVRAPTQTTAGNYDLSVEYSTLSDSETTAVNYAARSDADNVLVIDRSGSMGDFGKLGAAQGAARLYVDSWRTGDKIGVVSYAASASADLTLRDWNTTSRDAAITAINALTDFGGTSIGSGLSTGLTELVDRGEDTHDWAMILLSDGMNTVGSTAQDFINEYRARSNAGAKVPLVHTVALGADADRTTMQRVANATGGTYHYASEPPSGSSFVAAMETAAVLTQPADLNLELAEIYRVIGETVSRQQQIYSKRAPIDFKLVNHRIAVDGGAREAIFVLKWNQLTLDAQAGLERPDGTSAGPPTLSDSSHFLWRVPTPLAGEWTLSVLRNRSCEFCASRHLVEASLESELTMDVFLGLAPSERVIGTSLPFLVSLSDNAPISTASVSANITDPAGGERSLTLFDDGLHGDGAAGDGFFGQTLYQTSIAGSYVAVITARGNSPLGGSFNRRLRASFHMAYSAEDDSPGAGDGDGDGIPDAWEFEWGTDPNVADSGDDPDGDGWDNHEEFEEGTDPFDADTDDGGERDGSEAGDPHDPGDDLIAQPRARAWPSVGRVVVRHTVKPGYHEMVIHRSLDPLTGFTVVASGVPTTGEWIDGGVTNNTEYCYRVVAVGAADVVSAPSNATCATPRADPIAPTGGILINNGAPTTESLHVTLTLFAIDNAPEPEGDHPRGPPRPIDEAETSGVADMMLSNDGAFDGASWEPFQPTRSWIIQPVGDLAIVYVKYRDVAGNVSEPTHASIELVTAGPGPTPRDRQLGLLVGGLLTDDSLALNSGGQIGFNYRRGFRPKWSWEVELDLAFTDDGIDDGILGDARFQLLRHFGGAPARVRPFIALGVGAAHYNSRGSSDTGLLGSLGGGADFRWKPHVGFRVDLRVLRLQDVVTSGWTTNVEILFGPTFSF